VVRSGYLQIVCRAYYIKRSEDNRILPVRLIPPRGVLYDRYGKEPLADNETTFDMCVAPTKADHLTAPEPTDARRHEALRRLNLAPQDILEKLKASRGATFEPVVVKKDVDKYDAAYLAENSSHIPEIIIRARPKRRYKRLAAHIIGYTAPVDKEDLENGYVLSDVIGKAGVEAEYEEYLKGNLDWKMVEVNAFGHIVRDLPLPVKAEPGHSLNLTLDLTLQRKAEALLEGRAGAIIAMDPRNGEILAMASKPDFDPNIFAGSCSEKDWKELTNSYGNPLLNRAIMCNYPPGSTFKIVTATAALEEGKIDTNTRFYCSGRYRLENWNRQFKCHKLDGHGFMDVHEALVESCNVFFYNVVDKKDITIPIMHKYALMYGLGKKTGIDLPGEGRGFIPEVERYRGDRINVCIGQGKLLVTPLQMANLICVIANRGLSYKPHVVKIPPNPPLRKGGTFGQPLPKGGTFGQPLRKGGTFGRPSPKEGTSGQPLPKGGASGQRGYKPEVLVDLRNQVSRRTINIIREALKDVVKHGHSRQANLMGTIPHTPGRPDYQTAGKTGSAQNPHGAEHAWFIGFAPFENPEIAVAVVVENAGRGSEIAAPIAGQVFAEYLYREQGLVNRE
jgi:penicillin-binding protein 2